MTDTVDRRVSLVRDYIDKVWNGADPSALDRLTTTGYAYHLGGQPARDRTAMEGFLAAVRVAFPDWRVEIQSLVASGNTVAARWTGRVTHEGAFHGIPATGKRVAVSGINMYTIEGDRISEEWEQMDSLGMLQQLGVIPAP